MVQKSKILQKNIEVNAGVSLNKNQKSVAAAVSPAAAASATLREGSIGLSSTDSLLNGTATIGTRVRIHGLTNELRRLNFEQVCAQL